MTLIPARILCLPALALSQAVALPARAQALTNWSLAGAGCVPAGQTASSVGTFNSAGDAKFVAGRSGEIILTCPVPSFLPRAAFFSITYRDPDGPGFATRVRAVLRQKELQNGAVSDIAWARLDSNDRPPAPATVRLFTSSPTACGGGSFAFDHSRFTYYIQVNMERRVGAGDVLLASVDLGTSLIC